jgi:replicative DNA helicase
LGLAANPNEEAEEDSVTEGTTDSDGSDVVDGCVEDFISRVNGKGEPEVSTGIRALDRAIIGLRPKKTMVIAGRPGMGKTALAATIRRAVLLQDYVVLDFNLEMGKEELAERELAFQARVNLRKVMAAKEVSPEEMQRVLATQGSLKKGLWWVYDTCFSIMEIIRKCRLAKTSDEKG